VPAGIAVCDVDALNVANVPGELLQTGHWVELENFAVEQLTQYDRSDCRFKIKVR
jgi:hypothetical protein